MLAPPVVPMSSASASQSPTIMSLIPNEDQGPISHPLSARGFRPLGTAGVAMSAWVNGTTHENPACCDAYQ